MIGALKSAILIDKTNNKINVLLKYNRFLLIIYKYNSFLRQSIKKICNVYHAKYNKNKA